ncbi:MAG: hypothetical protein JWN98_419 [Abditibacteriota bacterium]|nr:hypothetical protein [Abditibacteriota bacterium]
MTPPTMLSFTHTDSTPVKNRFERVLLDSQLELQRAPTEILQINVGKKCNQICAHCHVNAGPARTEAMSRQTIDRIVEWLSHTSISTVDITGGAPELNPSFRHLVESVKALGRHVMDRCNLTILFEPGQEELAAFLAQHEVEIVASLPCYEAGNVEEQRGVGVFEKSIRALQLLNTLGYGHDVSRPLHLVYNPVGAHLPGPQAALEDTYKHELLERHGIVFNRLFTITNMPISRFGNWLRRSGQWPQYHQLLLENFNPAAVDGLMCRRTLNIGWRGEVYDCDFNQMLNLSWRNADREPLYLWQLDPASLQTRPILTGEHCFGCTAGAGSSCGGALL